MKHLKHIFALCFLISFTSCSGPLTESDNNTTVEYQLDSPFQIQLEGDANDNAKWVLSSKIEPIISLTNRTTQNKGDKTIYTFDFKVNTDGEKHLVLTYENDEEQLKIYQIKVIAGTMGRILED